LLLGESIQQHIPPRFDQLLRRSSPIDHPYHFFPIRTETPSAPVFGVFGNTGDGKLLEQVARAVKAIDPTVRFRLVGFVEDQKAVALLTPFVEDVSDRPIARNVFIERARSITHAVWLAPPDSFRMRASGTFFDTLSYGKPLLYTANPFIDMYYSQEPDIGTRCGTAEELAAAILATRSASNETYDRAVQAVERLRIKFAPEALAKRLPIALNWD
jgi:hypothetical protein